MQIITADALADLLDFPALIEALREMFRTGCESPTRHHHTVDVPGGASGTLLLMPAWQADGMMGVKTVTIFGDNAQKGLPSVLGQYYLMDATSGEPLALIEGTVLTRWRTAAASALASDFLSRRNSERLLMVGAGSLAPHLIRAHATVRPIREVRLWSRTKARAEALAAKPHGNTDRRFGGVRRVGRYHQLRHPLGGAAHSRRLVERRGASRSGRRLSGGHARDR